MILVAMMVKDEAETIAQTLQSVKATLGDELGLVYIHDTGSTDNTVAICQALGAVVETATWKDFATNRNELLRRAEQWAGDHELILMLDAGTILRGELQRQAYARDVAGWNVVVSLGNQRYSRPQLFRPGVGWKYEGRVHEAAIVPPGMVVPAEPCGLVVDYCLRDTARAERWHRDLALLEDDYTPRGRFYYAQTLELTGDPARAFFWCLHRGARTDGWYEEQCMAYIRAIHLAPSYAIAKWCCEQAAQIDPTRGEAWLEFALYAAGCASTEVEWAHVEHAASKALAAEPKSNALFVNVDREWKAQELVARAWYYQGNCTRAKILWTHLLDKAPEWAHLQIRENLKFCDL